MSGEYFVVSKSVLPDYFEKVLEAKELIRSGEAKDVSEAVRVVGISRSTYYKYRDSVYSAAEGSERRAVFSLSLSHKPGVLGKVLSALSECGANILTINQNPPIGSKAYVTISVDITGMECDITEIIKTLNKLEGVSNSKLLDIS